MTEAETNPPEHYMGFQVTDEITALKAEVARLHAKYEPEQLDPVEVLVASYAGFPNIAFVTAGQVDRMRNALGANGWRQVREVTEAEIMDAVNVFGSAYHATMPQILEAAVRHGIALARGEA